MKIVIIGLTPWWSKPGKTAAALYEPIKLAVRHKQKGGKNG